MKALVWLLAAGILAGLGYWLRLSQRRWQERKRASEERFATFMAQTMKPAAPRTEATPPGVAAPAADTAPQKLLFDAAAKAAEAGEPALSIQLYARLIARFPNGPFAAQARAGVEAQKTRLARP